MTKLPSSPDWAGGVWYDPCFLPSLDFSLSEAKKNELLAALCDRNWDIIIKIYNPHDDNFIYKRVANATLRADYRAKSRFYVWSPNVDSGRVVAIMPHGSWLEAFETRLTGKDSNVEGASDASLDRAITSVLGTPDE